MRLGVLADVHGNLHALDASLEFLAKQGVDAYVSAGDLVGYGPLPNECVSRVASLAGASVAGNHDLMAIDSLPVEGSGWLARDSLAWTKEQLTAESRDLLRTLPLVDGLAEVVVAHGALDDPRVYVRDWDQAQAQLSELRSRFGGPRILILGHTHTPLAFGDRSGQLLTHGVGTLDLVPGQRYLLNPGSVGQSRQRSPDARVMVLDLEHRRASFHALEYDSEACRTELRRLRRPTWSCHLSPNVPARARRMAARYLARRRS